MFKIYFDTEQCILGLASNKETCAASQFAHYLNSIKIIELYVPNRSMLNIPKIPELSTTSGRIKSAE